MILPSPPQLVDLCTLQIDASLDAPLCPAVPEVDQPKIESPVHSLNLRLAEPIDEGIDLQRPRHPYMDALDAPARPLLFLPGTP